jgi:hypothetical protein
MPFIPDFQGFPKSIIDGEFIKRFRRIRSVSMQLASQVPPKIGSLHRHDGDPECL